jgi:hypothetical protein
VRTARPSRRAGPILGRAGCCCQAEVAIAISRRTTSLRCGPTRSSRPAPLPGRSVAASVFVLLYQQLCQYLYFCTSLSNLAAFSYWPVEGQVQHLLAHLHAQPHKLVAEGRIDTQPHTCTGNTQEASSY